MSQVGQEGQTWPGGLTYVFQGTVAEDATAGTHICSLTLTPGQGNEMQLLYGQVLIGNTATAQTTLVRITDGTNPVGVLVSIQDTAANIKRNFPTVQTVTTNQDSLLGAPAPVIISGTMALEMKVTTAAVSVTETFAVVCRIHGQKPTAVLADPIGTPTLTTNTDAVF